MKKSIGIQNKRRGNSIKTLNVLIKFRKKLWATPCIINGWFSRTYENPRGFSIQ
jgi:hypothetical protein